MRCSERDPASKERVKTKLTAGTFGSALRPIFVGIRVDAHRGRWGVMAFRCAACGQDFVLEATLAPESTIRCSACEKIFGRTDAVVTEMVHLSTNISTDMLKLALQKLFSAS
jgi:hypothetical protein